jgi:hypothetical protein
MTRAIAGWQRERFETQRNTFVSTWKAMQNPGNPGLRSGAGYSNISTMARLGF